MKPLTIALIALISFSFVYSLTHLRSNRKPSKYLEHFHKKATNARNVKQKLKLMKNTVRVVLEYLNFSPEFINRKINKARAKKIDACMKTFVRIRRKKASIKVGLRALGPLLNIKASLLNKRLKSKNVKYCKEFIRDTVSPVNLNKKKKK